MNVEYIKLSDGTIAVTNENGIINKRKDDVSGNELFIENKIEVVEKSILESKNKVNEYKGVIYLAKRMLLLQPLIFVGASVIGFVSNNLSGLISWAIGAIFICVPASVCWENVLIISKRKLKGQEEKLEEAEKLKLEYEQELEKERKLKKESSIINEPVSLLQQNEYELPLINEQLETAYYDAIHSKPKEMTLLRRKK